MNGDLQFDEASHSYTLNGRKLESVTQVLEDVGFIGLSEIPPSVRNAALVRGSVVHEAIALDLENDLDDESVPPEYMGYVQAARNWRETVNWDTCMFESRVYHPQHYYAGTLDGKGTAMLSGVRRKVIVDWKTGEAASWVRYQLAAYAACFDSPGAEGRVCVEIHNDGTFRQFVFPPSEFRNDFDVFLSALTVMRVKRLPKGLK